MKMLAVSPSVRISKELLDRLASIIKTQPSQNY